MTVEADPGSGWSKAATTPSTDLASIREPTTHIQTGSRFLLAGGSERLTAGGRLAVEARSVTGDGGVVPFTG